MISYLKRGNSIGLCKYDSKEQMKKNGYNNTQKRMRIIQVFAMDGSLIGEYKNQYNIANNSKELFGVKLTQPQISKVIKNKQYCKGMLFKYKQK